MTATCSGVVFGSALRSQRRGHRLRVRHQGNKRLLACRHRRPGILGGQTFTRCGKDAGILRTPAVVLQVPGERNDRWWPTPGSPCRGPWPIPTRNDPDSA
jgi:hypothetical protein